MNIFKFIFQNSFVIISICVGGYSYIVITKGEGGDTFLGICSFAITLIFAMIVYRVLEWLAYEIGTNSSHSSNLKNKTECNHSVQSIISLSSSLKTMPKTYLGSHEFNNHNSTDTESKITATLLNENIIEEVTNAEIMNDEAIEDLKEESDEQNTLFEELKEYTKIAFKPFVRESDLPILLQILEDYSNCNMNCVQLSRNPTELNGITAKDIMHYGWNIWARLKPMNRQSTARFLKTAFPEILKETKTSSVYAKMTCDEGSFRIKIIKADESLL